MHPRPILALAAALLSLPAGACSGGGGEAGLPGDPPGFSLETTIAPSTYSPSGTTYYASPSGDDSSDGLSASTPWRTLRRAARALRAGDRLVLRGGRYVDDYFRPTASGTRDKPIVVTAYSNELPVITGKPTYDVFFHLIGVDWVVIDGLHFADTSGGTQIHATDVSYLTVRNSTFTGHGGTMINVGRSDHVLIEQNSFDTTGNPEGAGSGDHIYLMGTTHSVVQGNYFTRAGHYAIDLINYGPATEGRYSQYNVIRHNTIEQHWGGGIGLIRGTRRTLVEGNRILYAGEQVVDYPKVGIQIAAQENVVRRNLIVRTSARPYSNNGLAVFAYSFAGVVQHARHNRVYSNVVYKAGRAAVAMNQKGDAVNTGNKLVNNVFYHNRVGGPREPYWPAGNYYLTVETYHAFAGNRWGGFPNENAFLHNLVLHADASGDHPDETPLVYYDQENWGRSLAEVQARYPRHFQGNLQTNPRFRNAEALDFRLAPGSPAIDAGAHLARTRAAGSGTTTVPVDDVRFFTDGFGVVLGDLVRIGANGPVRVAKVDYGEATLRVESPVSFSAGDPVDLDYAGAGPDIGATEQ